MSYLCSKCENEDEKIIKEEEQIEILKIIGLIKIDNYFKNIAEENISQKFISKNIREARNYLIEEINRKELVSKKHKKVCLNYIEQFLILGSAITGCVSISAFASLVGIPVGITISPIGLKICAITAAIKKYKSVIKKKKKKHNKIVLSAKSKLNNIALIDSVISHYEFLLINNVVKEYNEMKEEIKNLKT